MSEEKAKTGGNEKTSSSDYYFGVQQVYNFVRMMKKEGVKVLKNGPLIIELDSTALVAFEQGDDDDGKIKMPKIIKDPDPEGEDDLFYSAD